MHMIEAEEQQAYNDAIALPVGAWLKVHARHTR